MILDESGESLCLERRHFWNLEMIPSRHIIQEVL
jgi:hypothetical protein